MIKCPILLGVLGDFGTCRVEWAKVSLPSKKVGGDLGLAIGEGPSKFVWPISRIATGGTSVCNLKEYQER